MLGVRRQFARSKKEAFVQQFKRDYGDKHKFPPYWMMVEILDLGTTNKLFHAAPNEIKGGIAKTLGIQRVVLESWFDTINSVRNTCCHHGRLWNRAIGQKPKLPERDERWDAVRPYNNRMFCVFTILNYSLQTIAPHSRWADRLDDLFERYPELDVAKMGFPADWKDCALWANLG